MHAFLVSLAILGADPLPAVPQEAELARAEADVQDVFGKELEAADTAKERAALARKMIETAAGSRPAAKYALLVQARDLAIAAGDSAAGVQAVAELVDGFAPEKQQDAAAWASEGHRLWAEGKALKTRLAAAECYLRCLDGLEGFQRAAAEKRLRGLGWARSPIDFNFDESTEGWKAENHIEALRVDGGRLVGQITGGDPFLLRTGLAIDGDQCPVLRIRLSLDSSSRGQFLWITKQSPTWGEPKVFQWSLHGDGQLREYRLDLSKHPAWTGQTIIGLRIDPGDWDHRQARSGSFAVDYVRGLRD